ncbi:PalH/RIM21-domain-containing protein [Peziza echinospora]|nr:PalH/RIM21-domain-containing protein [Peziza echinospora]
MGLATTDLLVPIITHTSGQHPVTTPTEWVGGLRQYNWRAPSDSGGEQLDANGSPTTRPSQTLPESCLAITISTSIILSLGPSSTVIVPQTVTYTPTCTELYPVTTQSGTNKTPTGINEAEDTDLPASSLRDPFYASTIPMAYSISTTITISYILLFLLFLSTPRPWLQKVATLTVVVCLTMAFIETTNILEEEYSLRGETWIADTESGSAKDIRERVVGGTEMRVGRIISDTFLWLAQVQTLIRLFPRHREKIVIKWAGFALIVLDTIFAILVHFLSPTTSMSPESFLDAIPALSYLFQIALSLLYGSCVVYYSLSSRIRRFAYYHPKAPNNILIAIISLISVLIPMVFFCLDIGQKDLAAWGDYVRWVGAAAASVVVWEWVDRIERLEREERREGVLGREVFDGDDGLVEDMGVTRDDDGPSAPKDGGGSAIGRSTTYSSAVDGNSGLTDSDHDRAGTTVHRRSQAGSTPVPSSDTNSSPSVLPGPVPRMCGAAGDLTANSSARIPTTDDGSESNGHRSSISFIGVRGDRRTTTPSHSERSTPGPVSNRTTVIDEDSIMEMGDNREDSRNIRFEDPIPISEKENGRSAHAGNGVVSPTTTTTSGDRWNALNIFKRDRSATSSSVATEPRKASWASTILSSIPSPSFPNNPLSRARTASMSLIESASGRSAKKKQPESMARRLPVTVIPAPTRERRISLRELEEARKNGVGDEGVGVWTGNSMRVHTQQQQQHSYQAGSVVAQTEGNSHTSTWNTYPVGSVGYNEWGNSPPQVPSGAGGGGGGGVSSGSSSTPGAFQRVSAEQYIRLPPQPPPPLNTQPPPPPPPPLSQQLAHRNSPSTILTASNNNNTSPPLSPATATASSPTAWGAGAAQSAYSIQQQQLFWRGMATAPPPPPPPPPQPPAQAPPLMCGAVALPPPSSSQTPPPPRQPSESSGGGTSTSESTRLARSRSLATGLGVVEEASAAGSIRGAGDYDAYAYDATSHSHPHSPP